MRTALWAYGLPHCAEEGQIMGMAAWDSISTIDQLLALPEDGLRHELLDGEHIVTPAPNRRHQRAVLEFVVALRKSSTARWCGG